MELNHAKSMKSFIIEEVHPTYMHWIPPHMRCKPRLLLDLCKKENRYHIDYHIFVYSYVCFLVSTDVV